MTMKVTDNQYVQLS